MCVIKYKTDSELSLIDNVDETPIYLEPITGSTLEKICANQVKIRAFGNLNKRYHSYYVFLLIKIKLLLCLLFKEYPMQF